MGHFSLFWGKDLFSYQTDTPPLCAASLSIHTGSVDLCCASDTTSKGASEAQWNFNPCCIWNFTTEEDVENCHWVMVLAKWEPKCSHTHWRQEMGEQKASFVIESWIQKRGSKRQSSNEREKYSSNQKGKQETKTWNIHWRNDGVTGTKWQELQGEETVHTNALTMGRGTGGVRREKDRRGNERGEKTRREEKGTGTEKQEVTWGH